MKALHSARLLLLLVFVVPNWVAAFDIPPAENAGSAKAASVTNAPEERWSSFLPLMKEEALARGYELPLPFGVSMIYNYVARDIKVTDLRIGVDGEPPTSVSKFVDLGSNSKVNAALVKGDVWVLPFLNPYVLAGYIHNVSDSKGHVSVPRPGGLPPREFDFAITTELNGFVAGGGLTLAAGYREFFMMMDANYTQTDIGFDDRFRALVASTRAGWNGKFGDVPVRLWLGAAYWDTKNTAKSTVDVSGVGVVQFEADQGPRNAWNMSVGASMPFSKRWDSFVEYGFNFGDVHILAVGIGFRF
jgi:hypothetical protein